ncbi:PLDc_N domain-containing protein [Kineosporia sp. J2-2]|uniref:PLDc_N domain-containing protein n=1 Tax=Kineosporia corallincola TaxID=2835133 RepID=A0ABS5T9N9_9ACTN|nr:PLD nuclease N-terminal domain-containing protein [Kineosporia corallincola]MBT0767762.1 PLDc_N domain-containing protein [Kineosporia corallincola]
MLLTALPALLYIGLVVYSVIDAVQTPADELYRLTRGQWVAVIILVPLFGAVCWLLASGPRRGRHEHAPGHPSGTGWAAQGMTQYPVGPDDDPDFIAGLARAQRQRTLTRPDDDQEKKGKKKPKPPERPEEQN